MHASTLSRVVRAMVHTRRCRPLGRLVLAPLALLAISCAPSCALAAVPGGQRSWELVTPAEPVAASVYDAPRIGQDGTHVLYRSIGPMPGAAGGLILSANVASRGEHGWSTQPVGFPYSTQVLSLEALFTGFPLAFSTDFSTSIWVGFIPLTADAPAEGQAALYRLTADERLRLLAEVEGTGSFIAASDDTRRVFFSSEGHLLAADAARTSGTSIYELDESGLHLVDVDSGGSIVSECGATVAADRGVSRSGARVFFASPPPSSACSQPSKVYLREDGTITIPVSASQCTRADCNSSQPVQFAGATSDGSVVYLTTTQQLTNSDVDQERDLYAFDLGTSTMRLLSEAEPGQGGEAIACCVRSSRDGSAVYFYARGRLLAGLGREGGENLYIANAAGVHFVAPVGVDDPLQISETGNVAAFATPVGLEEADTDGRRDVYVYNVESGELKRISAGTGGGNGPFDADISSPIERTDLRLDPGDTAVTADGSRVFFSTQEPLLPEDENEALDVYEWSPNGLDLVSSGLGEADAEFAGASADGTTVLFRTTATLLPADRDGGERDLYAARVGGGFPAVDEGSACGRPTCTDVPPPAAARSAMPTERRRTRSHRGPRLRWPAGNVVRGLVARGFTDLLVRVSRPGAVVMRGSGRYHGRRRIALRGVAGAVRAGLVKLRVRAAGWVRQALLGRHRLLLRILVRQDGAQVVQKRVLIWKGEP